jgi:hypothetical protein
MENNAFPASALPCQWLDIMDENILLPDVLPAKQSSKRQPSPEEWEVMNPRIQSLYIDKNRPLAEVAKTLEVEFNFLPS